jgi:hypothetical protein
LIDLVGSQELLLGLACIYPEEKRIFKLFPRVLKIDAISGANNEKRALLTVTVIDQNGKSHVVFRALLPNERAWTFQWIFQEMLPNKFGPACLHEINVIITDSDSQETSQLDIAVGLYFPKAKRLRCVWRIIDRGMHANGPSNRAASMEKQEEWIIVRKVLVTWMHSWMRSGRCEFKEELDISMALFQGCIQKEVSVLTLVFVTVFLEN